MKHNGMCFRLIAIVLVLMLVFSCGNVLAEEGDSSCPAAESETVATLLKVPDFKFFVRENGIGKGSCPIYTAPSEDSIRLADGKAACNVETEISVGGYVDSWLMVRCELKDGRARVGYIPPKYCKPLKANISKLTLVSIPVKLAQSIDITDNPRSNSTPFGTLQKGTEITILGKYTYTGNWWYVETKLNDRLTRGFIDRDWAALKIDGKVYTGNEELGFPALSPRNTAKTGMITVNGNSDDAMIVRRRSDPESSMVARIYGGESYPCYAEEIGSTEKTWYYIWVDGVWGWISSGHSEYTANDEITDLD